MKTIQEAIDKLTAMNIKDLNGAIEAGVARRGGNPFISDDDVLCSSLHVEWVKKDLQIEVTIKNRDEAIRDLERALRILKEMEFAEKYKNSQSYTIPLDQRGE